MGMSDYYKRLRNKVGHDLLMMPSVAAVIHDESGFVLMMRHRADNKWSLPAGATEPGERPAQAVVREVAEETGLEFGWFEPTSPPLMGAEYPTGVLAGRVDKSFSGMPGIG